jgi:hypothetical protein
VAAASKIIMLWFFEQKQVCCYFRQDNLKKGFLTSPQLFLASLKKAKKGLSTA